MKIFSAVIDITKSQHVAVSPPRPSQAAIEAGCTPTCFLIYHLAEDESQLLLERSVWSSKNITFQVARSYSTCPDFLFSIKGFTTTHVYKIVHSVWHDSKTRSFLNSIIEDSPQGESANENQAISHFIASMWVTLLPVKKKRQYLSPSLQCLRERKSDPPSSYMDPLRDYLADQVYASLMLGNGKAEIAPYHCGICRGVDHPRGLCPFPDIKGWNGPTKPRIKENSRTRGGQPRAPVYGAARK